MTAEFVSEWARGRLANYGGETIGVLAVDGDGAAAAADTMAFVSEVVAYEIDRGTTLATVDQVGSVGVLNVASALLDTSAGTPAGVWFYDNSTGADATRRLLSFLPTIEAAGFVDWPAAAPDGIGTWRAAAPTTTTVAAAVTVDATGFTGNLSGTDTDVQTALETLDALPVGGGGGGSIVGADDLDLSASSWPITADLSSWTNAGALILLPAPVSADPADSVLTVTLPDAGEGATLSVRCAVDTGTMDAVDVQFGGYDPGDDPWGVRATAATAHEAWLHVHYYDGGATWLAKWQPVTLAGGTGDVVGPASSTDGHLALFDGTSGKLIKDGGTVTAAGLALLDDADATAQRATLGTGGILGGQDEKTGPANTTTETSLLTSAPTVTATAGEVLRIVAAGSYVQNSGASSTPVIRLKLGGTAVLTWTLATATSATNREWELTATVRVNANNDANASGTCLVYNIAFPTDTNTYTGAIQSGVTLDLTWQHGTATSTQTADLAYYFVERIRAI